MSSVIIGFDVRYLSKEKKHFSWNTIQKSPKVGTQIFFVSLKIANPQILRLIPQSLISEVIHMQIYLVSQSANLKPANLQGKQQCFWSRPALVFLLYFLYLLKNILEHVMSWNSKLFQKPEIVLKFKWEHFQLFFCKDCYIFGNSANFLFYIIMSSQDSFILSPMYKSTLFADPNSIKKFWSSSEIILRKSWIELEFFRYSPSLTNYKHRWQCTWIIDSDLLPSEIFCGNFCVLHRPWATPCLHTYKLLSARMAN